MRVKDLRKFLEHHDSRQDEEELAVVVALPSIGPKAISKITHFNFGFDWDKGLLFITEHSLVPKHDSQSIYESAKELLLYMATKPTKKQGYEQRTAISILKRYGYTDEK